MATAENKTVESLGAGKPSAATEISYCPDLKIYHYRQVNGVEAFFSEEQLEKSVEAYLQNGDTNSADFMALLTGFARKFPHKVVSFDEQGKCTFRSSDVQSLPKSAG
jgi:hypothetical protein